MFWGRGDSSKLDPGQRELLEGLRRLTETGHIVALDSEDSKVAIEAVGMYANWRSVIRAMTSLKNVGLLVGGILALYWASQGALADWITKVGNGP